jgi:hypothetical protein
MSYFFLSFSSYANDLLLGIKKPKGWQLQEQLDARMRSEYHDPIERFPEKIDQLLEALNRV